MKKYTSRLLAALVSAAMLPLPSAPVLAVETPEAEPETDRYEIYPIPHSVEYPASDKFTVSNEVNVVYENDIDQYTKDYLQEILKENGLTPTTGSEAVSGKTNILLGVHDSNGAADAWFDANEQLSADLFEKTDAYALDVDQDGNTSVIAIVGNDTDAAFYGLSSLEMMFSSFEGNQLKEVSIEDYADKELRGFIEGFYGGFSYEGRETQIRFLRKVKGNMYVFASKTDPYHGGSNWQAQYPQEELNQIKHLVDVAKASKVRYAWSFHAGKSAFLNGASPQRDSANYGVYQERLAALLAKFQQLYDIGVRDFHILNDDYNSGAPADIALFLNDVNAWLKAKGDCGPLVYCPINYNRTWAAEATVTNELNAYKNNLDDDILLYWTGERVNCPVTQTDIDWVYERSGHEIVNWLNYPCSEHDKAGIYLGNIDFYFSTADNLQHTKGLMSNPVNYPEANKVAYFQLMSWLWNTQNFSENVDTIWKNSFKYIEPEVADSYAVVARHLSNCPDSGRYPGGFPESEDLKESLEALQNRLNSGVPAEDSEEFAAVYDEFKAITAAVADMKANGSEALLSDLNPWLNSLDAVAKAGIAAMDAYTAFSAGDMENAWIHLSKANEEFAKWDDNSPREYADKTAKGGSKRLYPFVKNLLTKMSNEILLNLNPDYDGFTPSVISSFGENTNTQKMIDGDETTFASWNSVQTAGDYYGLDLGRMLNIHDVEIIQGETDTHHDRFHESTLEYSADGENWTPIEENINESRIVRKNLDVRARYIRLRVTGFTDPNNPNKHDFWTRVREFTVNKSANTPAQIYTTQENAGSASIESTDSTVTLKTNSALTLEAGQSIGVKLTDPIFISSLQAAQAPSGCVLEYSLDGTAWSSETISGRETVRFARVRNTTNVEVVLPADFALNLMKTTGVVPTVTSDLPLKEGSWSALTDGNLTTYAWTSVNQAAGQRISVDLGRELPFNALSIYMAENRPRLYHGDISVSANGTDWKKVMTVNAADDQTVIDSALRYQRTTSDGSLIRYIRIDVTDSAKEEATEQSAFLKLHEILLNDAPLPEDVPSLFTGTEENMQLAADNDLTTCFEPKAPAGSFEYVIPEKTELPFLTIVQDAENFSNAAVKVLYEGDEEWTDLGTLEKSVNRFALDGTKKALRVRVNWSADQPKPKIYEIVMTGEAPEKLEITGVAQAAAITAPAGTAIANLPLPATVTVTLSDGTKRAVPVNWQTKSLDTSEPKTVTITGALALTSDLSNAANHTASITLTLENVAPVVNLALSRPVEASGTEVEGRWLPDKAVDGDDTSEDNRWSAPVMKSGTAADQTQTPQRLVIDLGEGTYSLTQIETKFFKKCYATDYDILVSDDKETWTPIKEGAGLPADASTMSPTDTIVFDTPAEGKRYIKFVYNAMNHYAAGNAISVWEVKVFGSKTADPTPASADKSQLSTVLTKAKGLTLSDYALEGQNLEQWNSQIRAAQIVYDDAAADQEQVNEAARMLNNALLKLRRTPDHQQLNELK